VVESQQQAIAQYSEALAIAPQLSHAWSGRALTYFRLGRWEMASKDFSRAIELSPQLYVNWLYRGRSYVKLARWDVAIVDYGKVIELVPKAAETYSDLAWLLAVCPDVRFRDPRRAVKLAVHAVELSPKEGGFWNTLGAAHYRAGDWADAVTAAQKSVELRAGGDSFDWFVLAMAHWQLNQKDEARKEYDRAVEWMEKNNPDDEELRRFSAEAGELLGVKGK
jgi:tetratricopeptide (TPR) repeat protein